MEASAADQPGAERAATTVDNEPLIPVHFGNTAVHEVEVVKNEDGETTGALLHHARPDMGQQTTTIGLPQSLANAILAGRRDYEAVLGGFDDVSAYREVVSLLSHHSSQAPAWVHSPHTELGEKVAAFLHMEHSDERPEWEHGKVLPPIAGGSQLLHQHYFDPEACWRAAHEAAVGTKAGRDGMLETGFGTSQPAPFNYIALSVNNTAIVEEESLSTATTLAEEYAVAGGGLLRAQAAFAHTSNTKAATLKIIFTANGTDKVFPLVFNKFAVFNKVTSGGTMAIEVKLASAMTFNAFGDKGEIVETIEVTSFT